MNTTASKNITILYSGGLDSAIMKRYAEVNDPDAQIDLLYVDLGQDYAYKELAAMSNEDVTIMNFELPSAKNPQGKEGSQSGNIIIPGRNMLLAVIAACVNMPDEIWMGALMGEIHAGSTDKNETFRDKLNDVISYVFSPFEKVPKLVFPFVDAKMGKLGITKWALANGFTPEELMHTSSCLCGVKGKCGTCVVCSRRWGIFKQLGFDEVYNEHPVFSKSAPVKMYIEMMRGELGSICHYDEYRREEIVPALRLEFSGKSDQEILEALCAL